MTEASDDQIIITVQRGPGETAGWLLQPQESGWQIPRSRKTSKTT